jgi:hypothetical protein
MTAHALATYLSDCRSRRGIGATTDETSLYSPFAALLNAVKTRLPAQECHRPSRGIRSA